ncbi:2-C-methyl-D-erythritol 4-phosphate cytidylyltransferase [Mucilaginibacter sp.]|uniref:2-C-methyl-D-erythritol 4-phosphate cytidylyltransferase n=1 Tax=Mucilaginibacter sp. TaxID=1882438 RepID=UPI002842B87F|nr:2-C-methyl-D-erythritol 4-phosphate cytidylyltransferase [Mucilaginibacter sp.]MDR3694827.1 2-C-methyl-D-erythritol 4-phosphate cytidylyltransferase [Mucilaginibacter sp.]
MKKYVIIVAGGSGSRMQAAVPKQFLALNGRPVLMHTVAAFFNSASNPNIIIVLPAAYQSYWEQLCAEYNFNIAHQLINGGETRFHSVKNGLDAIAEDSDALVAVHDAVRPLPGEAIINESYKRAAETGNAITAVKSRDSVRQLKNGASVSLLRDEIYMVQTPQTFKIEQLRTAYNQPFNEGFTDDASVAEAAGFPVSVIEGSYRNIKITFPEDIAIAEHFLKGL